MPVDTETILFSVHDLKLYSLTDPAAPTYGAPVDLPGVAEVGLDPQIAEAALRGDGVVIDQRSVIEAVTARFTIGRIGPAILAAIDGGSASVNAGATIRRYVRSTLDRLPEFGLAALISEVDDADGAAKLYIYRCKITGGTLFAARDNQHGQPSFNVRGIPLEAAEQSLWGMDIEDTASALPASGAAFEATRDDLV